MITCLALSPALDVTYLVAHVDVGVIHRPDRVIKLPGGKALNAARAIARLGQPVRVIAVLAGTTGSLIERQLDGSGIALEVVRVAGETRTCVTISSEDTHQLTEFYEAAPAIDRDTMRQIVRRLAALDGSETSWLVLSGSLPVDADMLLLVDALNTCRLRGIRIAVDTHDSALAELLRSVLPDLVKVNRFEAADLLGEPVDADLELLARGIQNITRARVVVTDGASGALAVDGEGVVSAPPPDIGHYPVGSGDCFLGAFLVATLAGETLAQALALANSCAAANAAEPGAALFDPVAARARAR